jgi:hypothetical protein
MSLKLREHLFSLIPEQLSERSIWKIVVFLYKDHLHHVSEKLLLNFSNDAPVIYKYVMEKNDDEIFELINLALKNYYSMTSKEYICEITEKSILHTLFIIPLAVKKEKEMIYDFCYDEIIKENKLSKETNIYELLYNIINMVSDLRLFRGKNFLLSSLCSIGWAKMSALGGVAPFRIKLIMNMINDVKQYKEKQKRLRNFFDKECLIYDEIISTTTKIYICEEDDKEYEIDKLIDL